MSWTADILYTIPNNEIISELKSMDELNAEYGVYLIDNLNGIESEWTIEMLDNKKSKNNKHYHSLPKYGLLAIKPIEYKTGYENDYSNYNFWQDLPLEFELDSQTNKLIGIIEQNISIEIPKNQIKIIGFSKYLSTKYNQPIVYYRCETWGGLPIFEFAFVFDKEPMLFLYVDDANPCIFYEGDTMSVSKKSVLQNSIKFVHQELSTNFFALHERSFNWAIYKV